MYESTVLTLKYLAYLVCIYIQVSLITTPVPVTLVSMDGSVN